MGSAFLWGGGLEPGRHLGWSASSNVSQETPQSRGTYQPRATASFGPGESATPGAPLSLDGGGNLRCPSLKNPTPPLPT